MANINNYINRQVPTVLYCEKEYDLLPGEHYGPIIRNVYIIECCVEGYGSVIINDKELEKKIGNWLGVDKNIVTSFSKLLLVCIVPFI